MRRLWLAVAVLAVFAVPALAGTKAGEKELSLSMATLFDSMSEHLSFVKPAFGYSITDEMEVGGGVGGWWFPGGGIYEVDVNLKWHFMMDSKIIPYVGPQVGYWFVDSGHFVGGDDSSFMWGALVGAKYLISDDVSLFAEYRYTRVEANPAGDINRVALGIGYIF